MVQEVSEKVWQAEARSEETKRFIRDINRITRRRFTAEEKVGIVLEGFRRDVPIRDLCRRSESKSLFINKAGDPLDVVGVKILIKRLGERGKVSVSPHKLRHMFAISYLRAGGDVFSLRYLLGHSTLQMTQRYLQSLNADDAINAHKKFSPLDNLRVTDRSCCNTHSRCSVRCSARQHSSKDDN